MKDLHDYVGMRFMFADQPLPDVTCVAHDPQRGTVRLHCEGGARGTVPAVMFLEAIRVGALVESVGAPFVHPPLTRFDRQRFARLVRRTASAGVAGTGKRIRSHAEMLKGRGGTS